MTDYEKGSPAWDIGMVLTRHTQEHEGTPCRRVLSLIATRGEPAGARLTKALDTECTCKAGDSSAETTSLREAQWPRTRTASPVSGTTQDASEA